MGKKTKAVIGLLVSGITDSFTVSVCRGAMKRRRMQGLPCDSAGKVFGQGFCQNVKK